MRFKKHSKLIMVTILAFCLLLGAFVSAQSQDERIRKALVFLQNEDYREAVSILEKVAEEDAQDADVVYLLGIAYVGLGQPEKAESQFRKVINLTPEFEDSYVQLASILVGRKDFTGASDILDRLKTVKPSSPWEPYARGVLMYMQNNISEAITQFNRAKVLDPAFTYAYANLGYIYYNEKKYEEALENFRHASRIDYNNPEYFFNMGWTALKSGNRLLASRYFEEASSLKAPHVYSAMEKTLKAYYKGEIENAEKFLEEVFRFQPDFSRGLYLQAKIHIDRNKYEEAKEIVNRMLEICPLDTDAAELRDEIDRHLKKTKDIETRET
jgi:tetratricopeptide (TPR) repeat protein